MRASRLKIN